MPPMLHKGSSCCPCQGEVQHVSWARHGLCKMFIFQGKEINVIDSRSVSGLTFCVCVLWHVSVSVADALKDNVWPMSSCGSSITVGVECKFPLVHWSETCREKRIILSNLISKKNKIAAMPSLCPWHSREMVIDLQQLLSFFRYLRYLLNRLLHWFLGRQMVVCMLQDTWRNEEFFSSVDQIHYSDVLRVHFYCA